MCLKDGYGVASNVASTVELQLLEQAGTMKISSSQR